MRNTLFARAARTTKFSPAAQFIPKAGFGLFEAPKDSGDRGFFPIGFTAPWKAEAA